MTSKELETLAFLFPDEPFEFRMNLRRGNINDFFATPSAEILAERARWLEAEPELYSGYLREAEPLFAELKDLVALAVNGTDALTWRQVGGVLGPDVILLEGNPPFRVVAGNVCFPSSWSLAEKIGKPLSLVHEPAPTLNRDLGPSIETFLGKLKPGVAWERLNWGLSATAEMNQHPSRKLPRLTDLTDPATVQFRLERQLLLRLPVTGGILFGISIQHIPLIEFANSKLAVGIARALETMPAEVARYKGLSSGRHNICVFLKTF